MTKLNTLVLAMLVAAGTAMGQAKSTATKKTFVGSISDSMCGLKHMMPGGDKACTVACLKEGSKYVLADLAAGKVYKLSDQKKPAPFAGQKVKVTGSLRGETITVTSIEPAP